MADQQAVSCFAVGNIAAVYEEIYLPRIFIPWARMLLERAALQPGERVLDIATGPGTVARLAAHQVGPQGRVVGADFSEAMIAIARSKPDEAGAARVEYIVSPAAPLPVGSNAFDVVTCQQGLQLLPDRAAAIREMYRALKPGGRLVAAVWREIARQPSFAALDTALRECLPAEQAEAYAIPFRWPKADELEAAFADSGFTDLSVSEVSRPLIYEGGIPQAIATLGASPVATAVAGLNAGQRARLYATAERRLSALVVDGQVRTQMVSNIVTARKKA